MNRTASPRSSQIHQGWLKKKGKRRWFILQGYSLYWFAKEQRAVTFQHKDVKGCLELKGYAVSVNREKTNTFIVSNLHDMNYYELTATTEASMNEWMECIRGCIQKLAAAEGTPQEQHFEGKRGVLTKKGQERLFVLKDDSLMWFLSKTGAEKKAKGSLPLKDLTLKRGPKGYSFVLQPKIGKAYVLFAASQSECDEWMAAVSKVIDILNNTQTAVKSGWLEKKGQKRYFVIKNGKLLWFKKVQKDDDAEANGYLLLESCTVTVLPPANGKYSLHIVSDKERTKREYTLTATSEAECTDWATALSSAATGETPPSPRWRLSMRAKPGSDPAGVAGVAAPLDSSNRSLPLATSSSPGAGGFSENFLSADKSGWLEKKGKRRWFVVTNGELAWYDQPRQHERGEKPNGSIKAKEASVASIGEIGNGYFAFAVYSAMGRDAEYLLQASSLNEMEDWVVALVLAGASPEIEKDRRSTTVVEEVMTRPDGLPENDKNGWMEKKGRKRWFVLRNSRLYWYKAVQENETGLKQEAAGSLDLRECTVKKLDEKIKGKPALLLSSSSKGEYLLLHQDQEEIDSWVKLIIEKGGASKYRPAAVIGKYGEESGTKNYFGLSLQQLLDKEGPAQHDGIPILVRMCIDHIRQHGMEAEGIFRVSGEQIDIVSLKQEFEATADTNSITFPTNIDVHSVSGLLKMFFRELNPPLMTFELYSDFMAAAGCVMSEIKGLIAQLPAENKTLLKYLMWFLYDVAQLGDLNKMRPMNLAIVFSPNLFRSDKSAFEVLANSSNAATVTQFIIANAHELFPEDSPASTDTPAPAPGVADVAVTPPLPVFPALPPMSGHTTLPSGISLPTGMPLPPMPTGIALPPVPGGVGLPPLPTRPPQQQQQHKRATAILQHAPPQLQVPGKIAAELAQRQFAQKGAAGGPAQ